MRNCPIAVNDGANLEGFVLTRMRVSDFTLTSSTALKVFGLGDSQASPSMYSYLKASFGATRRIARWVSSGGRSIPLVKHVTARAEPAGVWPSLPSGARTRRSFP